MATEKQEAKKCSTKVSLRQQNLMVDFIAENRNMQIRAANDTKWEELAATLNDTAGAKKPVDQWRRTFIEWKSKTKKKARDLVASQKKTGGGMGDIEELSEVEKKLLALIGPTSVTGDAKLCEAGIPDNVVPISPTPRTLVTTPDIGTKQATIIIVITEETSDMETLDSGGVVKNIQSTPKVAPKRKSSPSAGTSGPRRKTQKSLLPKALQQYATSTEEFTTSINNLASSLDKLANAVELLAKSLQGDT